MSGHTAGNYRRVCSTLDFQLSKADPFSVVVLGGERATDARDVLVQIHQAMQAGASGVAVGRNIWGHESPAKMTAAIAAIVHGNAGVDEAMRLP